MNYPEYTILVNESYVALSGEVMVKLDEGWRPQGGVAIAYSNGRGRNVVPLISYAQAMIKNIGEE